MSSTTRPPEGAPLSAGSAAAAAAIATLRAEREAAGPERSGFLLHELALLEERRHDEAAASREYLAAVNAQSDFREPLESLLTIIERRQSYKNLGRLLDRLTRIAEAGADRERALLAYAAHQVTEERDYAAARDLLEQAIEEVPSSAPAWLMLELCAARLGDPVLRRRALEARTTLAEHATWRSLLITDVAVLAAELGDADTAFQLLATLTDDEETACFPALLALESLASEHQRPDDLLRALRLQASLIAQSLDDAERGNHASVPVSRRTAAHAADAWLRTSQALRKAGDVEGATQVLDEALGRLPREPLLLHARLDLAQAAGQTALAAALARQALEQGATGAVAAAMQLRIAEGAAAEGDGTTALAAVTEALKEDPGSIPAQALKLDLLAVAQDGQALATALEAAAEPMPTDADKARLYVLSAEAWACRAHDAQGAKAALSQAALAGAPAHALARLGRLFAGVTKDGAWYEESTRRLLTCAPVEENAAELWLELLRLQWTRGDRAGAAEAAGRLLEFPERAWVSRALLALTELGDELKPGAERPPSTLSDLAEIETSEGVKRGLRLLSCLKAWLKGQPALATAQLETLWEEHPNDVVVAIFLSTLERSRGNDARASAVLRRAAAGSEDAALASALYLEAAILGFRSGDKKSASRALEEANAVASEAAGPLLAWALRAAEPDDVESRQQALDAATDGGSGANELERFALEIRRGGDLEKARAALDRIDQSGAPDLRLAAALARALCHADAVDERHRALESLEGQRGELAALGRAAGHLIELAHWRETGSVDAQSLLASASAWARQDPSSLEAALERLAAAEAAAEIGIEAEARLGLARLLPEALAAPLAASAAMLEHLATGDTVAPVASQAAAARLVNLELAYPGSDPRRRAAALADSGDALGDETQALALAMAGYNRLAARDIDGALDAFRAVVEAFPQEIIGWEGLRAAATEVGDRAVVAQAAAALGDAVSDDAGGAEHWEEAALILLDELGDQQRGEFALARAVERDVRRFKAFDRLFRSVRARRDNARLLELIASRLEVAEDAEEIAKLYWERARALRSSGDLDGALDALDNVTILEPDHVGALALAGEIFISTQRFREAADHLARLSTLDQAPAQQRLVSGVAAVDLYENKLKDVPKALEVLSGLHDAGLSTLPVRERLARAAAQMQQWDTACQVLEQLMRERATSEGRAEAARLALAIRRDKLGQAAQASSIAEQLLSEAPSDVEALEYVLSHAVEPRALRPLLEAGRRALLTEIAGGALDVGKIELVAKVAGRLEMAPLRQAALGAVVALGGGSPEIDRELYAIDQRVARLPRIAIDEHAIPELCDPDDRGPITELMPLVAATIAEAIGPALGAFGVAKKDRVDPREGLPLRNEVASWAGALGVGEFDLYVGGQDAGAVVAVATERPALVIGAGVGAPLDAVHRQAVARELFALRRGTTILRHREPAAVAALIVATASAAGVRVPSPAYALLDEFQRELGKALARKVRKAVAPLADRIAVSGQDPVAWVEAATASLDRLAAVAAGDVSWVLAASAVERGRPSASQESRARRTRLLRFVLSPAYLTVREQLGMGVR
jgi:hypothetical protein